MEFDFSPDQRQLKDQARRFLADHCGRDAVRAVLDGPQSFDAALWAGLGAQGYLGAAIPEAYGGLGAKPIDDEKGTGATARPSSSAMTHSARWPAPRPP